MDNVKYILATLIAVAATWMIHEFSHWITGELLGNDMVMTLNACYSKTGEYIQHWHSTVTSAAGPMVTLIQAIVVYYLLKVRSSLYLFPFLLTCLYMRFLAGAMNFINPNDEGRVSLDLGLGTFTLSIVIVAVLSYLTYDTIRTKGFKTKWIAATVFLIMLFSSVIILADQAFKAVIVG